MTFGDKIESLRKDKKWTILFFYLLEKKHRTYNCRKFWVDDNDSKQVFNTDYTADFVLAGLVRKEEDKVETSVERFRKPLKLQSNVEEIKFKNLYAKAYIKK